MVVALTALLVGVAAPEPGLWGADGHEIVCRMAWRRLTEEGRALVESLTGTDARDTFPASCYWADRARSTTHPHTSSYHFVNIPAGSGGFDPARDCTDEERRCVTWAVEHYAALLEDGAVSREQRAEALRFLSHFVADLHQPLHAGRLEDRGGNSITVEFPDAASCARPNLNLHQLWDSVMLCRAGVTGPDEVRALGESITDAQVASWTSSDVVAWTNESHRIVEESVYTLQPGNMVDDAYYRRGVALSKLQLQRAAVRLAFLINGAAAGATE